jgi:hypothetical protein
LSEVRSWSDEDLATMLDVLREEARAMKRGRR